MARHSNKRSDGLLQCPFCRLSDLEVDEYGIRCNNCGVEMPEDNGEFCDTDCGTRWNTRNGVELETKILSAQMGHVKRAVSEISYANNPSPVGAMF